MVRVRKAQELEQTGTGGVAEMTSKLFFVPSSSEYLDEWVATLTLKLEKVPSKQATANLWGHVANCTGVDVTSSRWQWLTRSGSSTDIRMSFNIAKLL
eukprot:4209187-Amphidinium_carterae.1